MKIIDQSWNEKNNLGSPIPEVIGERWNLNCPASILRIRHFSYGDDI